jgi:hypothetical protein
MGPKSAATGALAHHLHDAIARVREDMEKVEFWADAMTGFSQPVPDYGANDEKVWVPPEQAKRISASANDSANNNEEQTRSRKRR